MSAGPHGGAHPYRGGLNSRAQRLRSKLPRGIGLGRLDALLKGAECRICGAPVPVARLTRIAELTGQPLAKAPVRCDDCLAVGGDA
jgi:hypothetical protein